MPLPRFHLRTLMIAVAVAAVVLALAIQVVAWTGSAREGLMLILLLSIAWVPAVFVFLAPKVARWLFLLAVSASLLSLAFTVFAPAHGLISSDTGNSSCLVTFWLTFAFGTGYVATKAIHLPDRQQGRDPHTPLEADAPADRLWENSA